MYYFAYGSNMDTCQMATRCPQASVVGVACLPGYTFRINTRGVATVIPEVTKQVYGLLWDISFQDVCRLDRYEGVKEGLYTKDNVIVALLCAQHEEALIYLAADQSIGVPRPHYMEKIVVAAYHYGLPPAYLQELATWLSPRA
jgi:hypothetical protein